MATAIGTASRLSPEAIYLLTMGSETEPYKENTVHFTYREPEANSIIIGPFSYKEKMESVKDKDV